MLNERTINLLEFDKVKESVGALSASERARKEIEGSAPSFDVYEIERNLALTREADMMLNKFALNPVVAFDDIDDVLEKSKKDLLIFWFPI